MIDRDAGFSAETIAPPSTMTEVPISEILGRIKQKNNETQKEGRPEPSLSKYRIQYERHAHSGAMALTGHSPTQAPQSMQVAASMT